MHQQWTMPPRVLQIVATLIGLAAIAAFVMGVLGTPQRGGRLPGQRLPGVAATAPIDAEDATPLADERIQGPPPAANDEADDEANAAANTAASQPPAAGAPAAANTQPAPLPPIPPAANATPPQTLGGPPAPDEPPH
jgi:hypothetical protein